jgi:hypothetical protein
MGSSALALENFREFLCTLGPPTAPIVVPSHPKFSTGSKSEASFLVAQPFLAMRFSPYSLSASQFCSRGLVAQPFLAVFFSSSGNDGSARSSRAPQWSGQKRPMVVGSKPANGCSPERGSFILVSPGQASPFLFSSFVARISECDRGVAVGRAWR